VVLRDADEAHVVAWLPKKIALFAHVLTEAGGWANFDAGTLGVKGQDF
jgi:hypothetical protein